MNETQAVVQTPKGQLDKPMEYVPFGAADKIRLTISIIQNIVAVPTKSGKTCSERDATKFMMLCQAQRLNPFAGDAYLVGYDGQNGPSFSLITAHQAFLKRAETNEDFDGMTSGILIRKDDDSIEEREGDFHLAAESENVVGGWARVFHKKRSHPTYRKLRMARFNKGFAQWKEDAAGMIVKCAEADALRSTFPTLMGGLYLKEEQAIAVESTVVSTAPSRQLPDFGSETPEPEKPKQPRRQKREEAKPAEALPLEAAPNPAPEGQAPALTQDAIRALRSVLNINNYTDHQILALCEKRKKWSILGEGDVAKTLEQLPADTIEKLHKALAMPESPLHKEVQEQAKE